jgi:ATP-binding cassette subfamily C exporter for protease/lipase
MCQRIALARAVYDKPCLLVLDEPNANLDEAGEIALGRLVRARRDEGATVFVISHRPAILSTADRVIVLQAGRIRLDGPPADVLPALRPPAAAPSLPPHTSPFPA